MMDTTTQTLIEGIIKKQAVLENYPKPAVNFIALDPLLNDADLRKKLISIVADSIDNHSFDCIAPIASRGYFFSGMMANINSDTVELPISKVKAKGDSHFIQLKTQTEYSQDDLQILKGMVIPGKKYLVVDDLIATGGSVKTAIDLIKEAGGLVDTVFTLTELVDFDARSALAKEGVNLISPLKFTNDDLSQLLSFQEAYKNSNSAPLSYKLSQHQKGEEALILSNAENPLLNVHLASQSIIKQEALTSALNGLFSPLDVHVNCHDVSSDVSSQPFDKETKQGAINRLHHLKENLVEGSDETLVAIENGIRYSEETNIYYDFVHVIIKKGDSVFEHTQDCCQIPFEVMARMEKNEQGEYIESWGVVAKRMGLTEDSNNPHQAPIFGGVSRATYLSQALCNGLGQLKAQMMQPYLTEGDERTHSINRSIKLNDEKATDEYASMGVSFSSEVLPLRSRPINFYNQGARNSAWQIDDEKLARNSFKVFQTGDAFSIMSPDIEIAGANITIHIGTEHEKYSPLVLLQEGLQLCRCAYEHGARSVTVALPEAFHPVLNSSDFNALLMDLFKSSGANNLYYYGEGYKGKLDINDMDDKIPLSLSKEVKTRLADYVLMPDELETFKQTASSDAKIMHFTRRDKLKKLWQQFETTHNSDILNELSDGKLLSDITIPDTKFRPHILLCCSANKIFAKEMAEDLRLQGELVQLYNIDEQAELASIPKEATICGSVVTVVQSTHPSPDDLKAVEAFEKNGSSTYFFEAALIAHQAHLRGAIKVNLVNPYQFSARSDKAEDTPKGKTGAYVQHNGLLLKAAGFNHVTTAECHDTHTISGTYTGDTIRGTAVPALSVISSRLAVEWLEDPSRSLGGQLRLVAPDAGAAKRTKELTQQLQAILGKKLNDKRILGEKQRDSHKDDSAMISSLNSGGDGINAKDKYLITDDETATGSTLCQAITSLQKDGAEDISVIVVHNNMPMNWLLRQLCLTRFLYLGVSDLHFSDTHEMGALAGSYEEMISTYAEKSNQSHDEVEQEVLAWFKKNILSKQESSILANETQSFDSFKSMITQLKEKVRVHSLADEFANNIKTKPYSCNPYAFNHKVSMLVDELQEANIQNLVVFEGGNVALAGAAARALNLPLKVLPALNNTHQPIKLPDDTFALIGALSNSHIKRLSNLSGRNLLEHLSSSQSEFDNDLMVVPSRGVDAQTKPAITFAAQKKLNTDINQMLDKMLDINGLILDDPKFKNVPVKLLAIDKEGQMLAGQISYELHKRGIHAGIVAAERNGAIHQNISTYSGQNDALKFTVDRNSLNMGEVCIVVASDLTVTEQKAIEDLTQNAKVQLPFDALVQCSEPKLVARKNDTKPTAVYSDNVSQLFFVDRATASRNDSLEHGSSLSL